uniref:Uncharacterized protein n=1 Tax=Acrobeloides nanus TaxID=290746 RepID=A0A914DT23_9BILA
MSALLKQLNKEKCLDILMEKLEHPQHQETSTNQVQSVDIKYEPQVPDRVYKYHIYEWQHKNKDHQQQTPISEVSMEHEASKEGASEQVVAKYPPHEKWSENTFDEELYKHINFQY